MADLGTSPPTRSIEFLVPDLEQIRHQLRGILESYSHDWDLLAELAQNAVDAVSLQKPLSGLIQVEVDAPNKRIVFEDNGCGIDPADLPKLLRPFGTSKAGSPFQIGQKGVGLTFAVFSSDLIIIQTRHENGSARATIEGANGWLHSTLDTTLQVNIEPDNSRQQMGTRIEIRVSDKHHPLWALSFEELLFVLRTRTALGNTGFIWGGALNCAFTLSHMDQGGREQSTNSDCIYLLPIEGLAQHEIITLDDYNDWLSEADRTDAAKRGKLKDKILVSRGSDVRAGRELRYWSCFVPRRDVWLKLSKRFGLCRGDEAEQLLDDDTFAQVQFASGLQTSSKGMPTGISIELRPRGAAGYVPNFFILIEDPSLSFDIGRKSIQSRQQGMLRELAFKKFGQFVGIASKYVSGSPGDVSQGYDREELLEEIRLLPDLNCESTRFLKRPDGQEATVAGMFFEAMGNGRFGDFRPFISGYKGRYDLYGRLDKKLFVLEFKYSIAGLLRDFSDERKMFDEIDGVVIWDVEERDRKMLSARMVDLEEVKQSEFADVQTRFPIVHFRLRLAAVKPIEIICMRRVLGCA